MTQNSKPTGRPTFRINGTRLRALRNDAHLTQYALAEKVYNLAGKSNAKVGVIKTSAYRWEKTGMVPRDMANHLAEVLNTTIAVLQGELPEPAPSRVDEIVSRIKQQVTAGPSPELVSALECCRDDDNPIRDLAIRLTSRLEAAQLSQATEEFEKLATLTGLNVRELRCPMSQEGFWFLIGTGYPGPERAEILSGVINAKFAVISEMQKFLENAHE